MILPYTIHSWVPAVEFHKLRFSLEASSSQISSFDAIHLGQMTTTNHKLKTCLITNIHRWVCICKGTKLIIILSFYGFPLLSIIISHQFLPSPQLGSPHRSVAGVHRCLPADLDETPAFHAKRHNWNPGKNAIFDLQNGTIHHNRREIRRWIRPPMTSAIHADYWPKVCWTTSTRWK